MDDSTINIDDNHNVYINKILVGKIDMDTMEFVTPSSYCSYFTSERLHIIAHAIEELKSDRYWNS